MRYSEYYLTYRGNPLSSCHLEKDDITSKIIHAYGPQCNWQGTLWTYGELFGNESLGKTFRFTFRGDHGTQWFYGHVNDLSQYMIPPRFHS
jgi:hypothetical protein